MFYKVLADSLVHLHFLWILFLFFGGYWGWKRRFIRLFHLSGLFFALLIQSFDWYCPLTILEVWLRSRHDPTLGYAGSFIVHYVEKVIYIELRRSLILIFTVLLVAVNLWFYLKRKKGFRYKLS